MYIILEKNYKTFQSKEIYRTYSLLECHYKIEEIAQEYIKTKEGDKNLLICGQSGHKILKPKLGFFMKKSKNFNKISIYCNKKIKGYISNEIKKHKIITFEIVKIKAAGFEYRDFNDYYLNFDEYKNPEQIDEFLEEIKKYFEKTKLEKKNNPEEKKNNEN